MSLDVLPQPAPLDRPTPSLATGGAERSDAPAPASPSSGAVALALSPDAATSFAAVQTTDGLDTALRRLQDGAFGTPASGSPLTLAALVEGIRAENGLPALDGGAAGDGLPADALPGASGVELAQTRSGALNWVLGVLQGDFNQDPSLSQTIVNTVLTAIPGLDQLGDARDLIANTIQIARDPSNTWAWMGAALTGVGLVPTVGSVLKGVGRIAVNGDGAYDVYRALDRLGINEPGRFLRDNVGGLARDAVDRIDQGLDRLADALRGISGLHPSIAGAVGELDNIRNMGTDRLQMAADHVQRSVGDFANRIPDAPVPKRVAREALSNFVDEAFTLGGVNFELGRGRMQHFLTRHHPEYWTGRMTKNQDWFDRTMSVQDVRDAAVSVLRQNYDSLVESGARPGQEFLGTVDGVQYRLRLGTDYTPSGRLSIGQFHPVSN